MAIKTGPLLLFGYIVLSEILVKYDPGSSGAKITTSAIT